MRRSVLLSSLVGSIALWNHGSAMANDLVGQWQSVGQIPSGGEFVHTVLFAGDGTFQAQMAVTADPRPERGRRRGSRSPGVGGLAGGGSGGAVENFALMPRNVLTRGHSG